MSDDARYFHDTRAPYFTANNAAVTLLTTLKALYPIANFPVLGGNYWDRIGKKLRIRSFHNVTTGTTPGTGLISILYGTGADANGVTLASSAAFTLVASQTNLSMEIDVTVRCITLGATGTLEVTGKVSFNSALVATFVQMIPASAAAPSAACDLTAANIISLQMSRTGSTAETVALTDLDVQAL